MINIVFPKPNTQRRIKNASKGFTLIELLIAMAIFSIGIGAAVSILSVTIKSQRIALATQEILDQTSYALEYFSRAMRMTQPETLQITGGGSGVKFTNSKGVQQEIFVENGQLKQSDIDANGNRIEALNLTSSDAQIISAGFVKGNNSPPTITFALDIKTKGSRPQDIMEIMLQTTISQRNF